MFPYVAVFLFWSVIYWTIYFSCLFFVINIKTIGFNFKFFYKKIPQNKIILLLILLIPAILVLGIYLLPNTPLVDERNYYPLVQFFKLNPFLYPDSIKMATIPGHAYIVFLLSQIVQLSDLFSIRVISASFSFVAIIFAYLLSEENIKKTTLIFLLPIGFPFFFLLYTDIPALASVLVFAYCMLKGKHILTPLIALISLLLRQDTIFWVFLFSLYYFSIDKKVNRKNIIKMLIKYFSPLIMASIFLLTYTLINGGVGFSKEDRIYHPIGFFIDNILYFIFLHLIIFLPLHIRSCKKNINSILTSKLKLLGFIIFLVSSILIFKGDHPFYSKAMEFFFRHSLIITIRDFFLIKITTFTVLSFFAVSILNIPLLKNFNKYFYPITICILGSHWLVEPRYYIIPFSLFLIFMDHKILRNFDFIWILFWTGFVALGIWGNLYFP